MRARARVEARLEVPQRCDQLERAVARGRSEREAAVVVTEALDATLALVRGRGRGRVRGRVKCRVGSRRRSARPKVRQQAREG